MAKRPTTTYGQRKVSEGVTKRRIGAVQTVLGGAVTAVGIGSVLTGDLILGGAAIGLGSSTLSSGLKRAGEGISTVSKGRATESLINRARTGNTLGIPGAQRGSQSASAPQIGPNSIGAAFKAANREFVQGRNGAAAAQSGNGVAAGKRGWANPKTQAAAQRAKGNKYNGPTE